MSSVIIRPFNPNSDSGFIYSSYPKGAYYGAHDTSESVPPLKDRDNAKIKAQWFKAFYQQVQQQLISSTVLIACISDEPNTVLGYAILSGTTLEWVYVKELFRNQGIAKLLVKNQQVETYRNITKVGFAILSKHKEEGEKPHVRTAAKVES